MFLEVYKDFFSYLPLEEIDEDAIRIYLLTAGLEVHGRKFIRINIKFISNLHTQRFENHLYFSLW